MNIEKYENQKKTSNIKVIQLKKIEYYYDDDDDNDNDNDNDN